MKLRLSTVALAYLSSIFSNICIMYNLNKDGVIYTRKSSIVI